MQMDRDDIVDRKDTKDVQKKRLKGMRNVVK